MGVKLGLSETQHEGVSENVLTKLRNSDYHDLYA